MAVVVAQADNAANASAADLRAWLSGNAGVVTDHLLDAGAILFRGFGVDSPSEFQECVRAAGAAPVPYIGGNSPRTKVEGDVYTSTEFPPEYPISLHNELSYENSWPQRLFFACIVPPSEGGQTPLADCREALSFIGDELVSRFDEKGVTYVQNLHSGKGLGRSWQDTFETSEQQEVERHLTGSGDAFAWRDDGSLTITRVRRATATHPTSGDRVWFNQADQWHPSSLGEKLSQSMLSLLGEENLPHNARHSDGSPMDVDDLTHIRDSFWENSTLFDWEAGDFLMFDNMLVAHGRRPFSGPRKIVVAMA